MKNYKLIDDIAEKLAGKMIVKNGANPARACQESDAQACPPAASWQVNSNTADTVQLTHPFHGTFLHICKDYGL